MSLHHAESMTAPGHAGDSDHEGARVHPSTGCSWRELLLVLVLAALLWGGYLARTDFHVFPRDDVMQAVVAARQFAAGEGHTSRVATPTMLVFLAEQGRLERPWPNALRSPLPVVLMGSLMGFVSEPTAVALSSGIFFVLAVPLIYLIGCRLAGRWAGGLAAIAFVLAPSGLYLGSTGMTESSTIFALAAIILLLMRPFTWRGALLAGVALGIGYLGRSTMQMWALVMVLYVIWASLDDGWGRAIARAAVFVAPLALAVWWWGGQMEALTG
ncbi:MAG: glycosyltransferase family 39 protein, partial [Armatimonadota bacterium]